MFWSNNGKDHCVDVKTVASVLKKYGEPPCILELITTSGKIIEADVSFLRTGVYIISIVNNDFAISRKFIKN